MKEKKQLELCSSQRGKQSGSSSLLLQKISNISFGGEAKGIEHLDTNFRSDSSGDVSH